MELRLCQASNKYNFDIFWRQNYADGKMDIFIIFENKAKILKQRAELLLLRITMTVIKTSDLILSTTTNPGAAETWNKEK